jgi:hypothetical protein
MGIKIQYPRITLVGFFFMALLSLPFLASSVEAQGVDIRHWDMKFNAFKSRYILTVSKISQTNYRVVLELRDTRNKAFAGIKPGKIWQHQFKSITDPRVFLIENELVAGGFFGWIKTESDLDFESFFFLSSSGKVLVFPRPPIVIFTDALLTYTYDDEGKSLAVKLIKASSGATLWKKSIAGDFSQLDLTSQWQNNPDCFDLEPSTPRNFSRLDPAKRQIILKKIEVLSKRDLSFCLSPGEKIKDRQKLTTAKNFPLKEEYRIAVNSPNNLRQFSSSAP